MSTSSSTARPQEAPVPSWVLPAVPTLLLNDRHTLPIYGAGFSHNGGWDEAAVRYTLRMRTPLLDTAKRYGTERRLRTSIAATAPSIGGGHGELPHPFVTSKLWVDDVSDPVAACRRTGKTLGIDCIDLYLVHWPDCAKASQASGAASAHAARAEVWRKMLLARDAGLCRSVGVSNFMERHLTPMLDECGAASSSLPCVNQIEFNPLQFPRRLMSVCQGAGIVVQGYCPFAKGRVLSDASFLRVAADVQRRVACERERANKRRCVPAATAGVTSGDAGDAGVTPAQVALRWAMGKDVAVIPMSMTISHIDDNARVFNLVDPSVDAAYATTPSKFAFDLTDSEVRAIDGLHADVRVTWDPTNVL